MYATLTSNALILSLTASYAVNNSHLKANAAELNFNPEERRKKAATVDSKRPFAARECELPAGHKSADLVRAERTA